MDIFFFGKDMRREPHEERWINEERFCFYTSRQIPEKKTDWRQDWWQKRTDGLIPKCLEEEEEEEEDRFLFNKRPVTRFATLDRA